MNIGDAAALDDIAVLLDSAHHARGITYWRAPTDLVEAARPDLLDVVPASSRPRHQRYRFPAEGNTHRLGCAVATHVGHGDPVEVLVNRNASLALHYDVTGPPDSATVMVILRDEMDGGACVLPERGLGFGCADGWALCFDARTILHGVTPMTPTSPDGYRISVVYYLA